MYTFPMGDVIDTAYTLTSDTMEKVNQGLLFGVGILKVEDLKRKQDKK